MRSGSRKTPRDTLAAANDGRSHRERKTKGQRPNGPRLPAELILRIMLTQNRRYVS